MSKIDIFNKMGLWRGSEQRLNRSRSECSCFPEMRTNNNDPYWISYYFGLMTFGIHEINRQSKKTYGRVFFPQRSKLFLAYVRQNWKTQSSVNKNFLSCMIENKFFEIEDAMFDLLQVDRDDKILYGRAERYGNVFRGPAELDKRILLLCEEAIKKECGIDAKIDTLAFDLGRHGAPPESLVVVLDDDSIKKAASFVQKIGHHVASEFEQEFIRQYVVSVILKFPIYVDKDDPDYCWPFVPLGDKGHLVFDTRKLTFEKHYKERPSKSELKIAWNLRQRIASNDIDAAMKYLKRRLEVEDWDEENSETAIVDVHHFPTRQFSKRAEIDLHNPLFLYFVSRDIHGPLNHASLPVLLQDSLDKRILTLRSASNIGCITQSVIELCSPSWQKHEALKTWRHAFKECGISLQ